MISSKYRQLAEKNKKKKRFTDAQQSLTIFSKLTKLSINVLLPSWVNVMSRKKKDQLESVKAVEAIQQRNNCGLQAKMINCHPINWPNLWSTGAWKEWWEVPVWLLLAGTPCGSWTDPVETVMLWINHSLDTNLIFYSDQVAHLKFFTLELTIKFSNST